MTICYFFSIIIIIILFILTFLFIIIQVLLSRHDGSGDEDLSRKLYMSAKKSFFALLQKVVYILELWRLAEEDDDFEETCIALSSEKSVLLKRDEERTDRPIVAIIKTFDHATGEHKRGLMFTVFKNELEAVKDKAHELRQTWEINEAAKASDSNEMSSSKKKKIGSLRVYKWLSSADMSNRDEVGYLTEEGCRREAERMLGKDARFDIIKSSFAIPSRKEIMKYSVTVGLEILKDTYGDESEPNPPKRMKRLETRDPKEGKRVKNYVDHLLEKNDCVEIASQKVVEQLRILSMQQHNMFVFQSCPETDFNTVLKETVAKHRRTETFEPVPPILRDLVEDSIYSSLPDETGEDSDDTQELVMA